MPRIGRFSVGGMLVLTLAVICWDGRKVTAAEPVVQHVIALSGDVAPGTGGLRFSTFGIAPWIDAQGRATLQAGVQLGPGIDSHNSAGFWGPTPDSSFGLILRDGSQPPFLPAGWKFDGIQVQASNAAGELAMTGVATLYNGNQFVASTSGVWTVDPAGRWNLVAQKGAVAPGTGGGAFDDFRRANLDTKVQLGNTGVLGFQGFLALGGPVTTDNAAGVWSTARPGGPLDLRLRTSDPVRGTTGRHWALPGPVNLNGAGQILVRTSLAEGHQAIGLSNAAGGFDALAIEGDAAPGAGGRTFANLQVPSMNDGGDVVFASEFNTGGTAVWRRAGTGPVQLVAKSGDAAPGLPGNARFNSLLNRSYAMADGSALFGASVEGSDVTGFWKSDPGGAIARLFSSDQLPTGLPATHAGFDPLTTRVSIDSVGDVIATGLIWPDGFGVSVGTGLWEYDAGSGRASLWLRTGQSFTVAPGDIRTISRIDFLGGGLGEDGAGTAFNDAGQLAVTLEFTDNTSGAFVLAAPEPAGSFLALAGAPLLLLLRRRRRPAN